VKTHAEVVHRVTPEEARASGRRAGAGLQFVGADDEFRQRLDACVAPCWLRNAEPVWRSAEDGAGLHFADLAGKGLGVPPFRRQLVPAREDQVAHGLCPQLGWNCTPATVSESR